MVVSFLRVFFARDYVVACDVVVVCDDDDDQESY